MRKFTLCLVTLALLSPALVHAQISEPPGVLVISTGGPAPLGVEEVLLVTATLQPDYVQIPEVCQTDGVPVRLLITHAASGIVVRERDGVISQDSRLLELAYRLRVDVDGGRRKPVPFHAAVHVPEGMETCIAVTVGVATQNDKRLNPKFDSVATSVQSSG